MAENLIPVPTIEAIRAHLDEIIKIVRVVEAVLDDEVEKHKEPEQVIRSKIAALAQSLREQMS